MKKREIVEELADRMNVTLKEADLFVREYNSLVRERLLDGEQHVILGVCTMKIIERKPRRFFNLNTKQYDITDGRKEISIKQSVGFLNDINSKC